MTLDFARRSRVLLMRHVASAIDLERIFSELPFERSAIEPSITRWSHAGAGRDSGRPVVGENVVFEIEPHRWSVRVAAARTRATVYARTQRFEIGLPLSFDAEYEAVTALETVLGAIGADVACGVQRLAALKRLRVDGAEAVVQAELINPLIHLGVVGEEGSAAMKRISVKLYLDSLEDEDALRRVFDEVAARSALIQTFDKAVELELELRIVM